MQDVLENLRSWIFDRGFIIFAIIVVAFLVSRFAHVFIEKTIRSIIRRTKYLSKEAEKKREDTLITIFNGSLSIIVWTLALVTIISELGVEIGPILAAAGIVGVAVGFGAQYLVKDLISGIFILFENQYRVNDVVCFDKTCGLVEDISLRMTTLRDLDGTVHYVPHGEVKIVSNLTKVYSRVNLDIKIPYGTDVEKVIHVINKICKELSKDSEWKSIITKEPEVLRVDSLSDSGIVIKILGDTKPIKQWDVMGELRKRILVEFNRQKISIAIPHIVVKNQK